MYIWRICTLYSDKGEVSVLRGIRGASTVEDNTPDLIFECVLELLEVLQKENSIDIENIAAVIFSSTPDLNAAFPAAAARKLGWNEVPLFGTQEIDNPDGVKKCIRVLILLNTQRPQGKIKHIYLRGATVLRKDIAKK